MLRAISCLMLFLLPPLAAQEAMPDYKRWRSACARLPANRELRGKLPDRKLLPLTTFAEFERALDGFLRAEREGPLAGAKNWVGEGPDPKGFFDASRSWYAAKGVPFQPFAAKLVLPNDAVAILMGDLHGDVRSLLRTLDELNGRRILDGFRFRESKYRFIFLGDFTDRGVYGVEVLYTLYRLKMANPEQVFFARGNHEDFNLASRYGFLDELRAKFGKEEANVTKVMRSYDLLPVVLYVGNGSDFLQMNHGGMEPGYDPRKLLAAAGSPRFHLLGKLRQREYHAARPGWLGDDAVVRAVADKVLSDFTPDSPTSPAPIGFMWNDFTVFTDEPAFGVDRGLVFGPGPTRRILADASTAGVRVRAVVRAHQHVAALDPLMSRLVASDGVFRHWQEKGTLADAGKSVSEIRRDLRPGPSRPIPDGSVWTFNVAPDSAYGVACKCDFVTVGMLTLAPEFSKWRMSVLRIPVF